MSLKIYVYTHALVSLLRPNLKLRVLEPTLQGKSLAHSNFARLLSDPKLQRMPKMQLVCKQIPGIFANDVPFPQVGSVSSTGKYIDWFRIASGRWGFRIQTYLQAQLPHLAGRTLVGTTCPLQKGHEFPLLPGKWSPW